METDENILLNRAKKLAKSQHRTAKKIDIRCIEFTLCGMSFAFEIQSIREILRYNRTITPLPFLPPFLIGVMNVRGEVVPVVDLGLYVGLPTQEESKKNFKSLIILQKNELVFAFPCERIVRIREFSNNELQPSIAAQSQIIEHISKGCGRGGITILDADACMMQLKKTLLQDEQGDGGLKNA